MKDYVDWTWTGSLTFPMVRKPKKRREPDSNKSFPRQFGACFALKGECLPRFALAAHFVHTCFESHPVSCADCIVASHSIVGYVYLQQSLLPPPTIPRYFESKDVPAINEGFHHNPFTGDSTPPVFVPGVLDAHATFPASCIELCNGMRIQKIPAVTKT